MTKGVFKKGTKGVLRREPRVSLKGTKGVFQMGTRGVYKREPRGSIIRGPGVSSIKRTRCVFKRVRGVS